MANFWDLPTEIWLIIAENLTEFQLFKLKSVNSFFLNYCFDRRWKKVKVDIDTKDSRAVADILTRMVDPFVAVRTKSLSIRFGLAEPISPSSSNICFDTALTVLPLLLNLTFLAIEIFNIPTSNAATFFRTIESSSVAKIRKLSFKGDVKMLASLGKYSADNTPFENLTELILELEHTKSSTRTEPSRTLEPFLRSLAPTLQLLHLRTYTLKLDLSPLFDALQPTSQFDTPVIFPNLKSFCLVSNFKTFHSLRRFFFTHNNWQRLELNPGTTQDDLKLWDAWLPELVNSRSQFPFLQSLNIFPSTTQAGLSAVLTLIKFTASTLSSLELSGRCLTFEEAKQVVDALTASGIQVQGTTMTTPPAEKGPKRLKRLSMGIAHLSVSLLDLLAGKLPQLEELSLSPFRGDLVGSDKYSFPELLQHRRYDPNITCTQDVLHSWKLHQLSISPYHMDIVRAVAGAVPTLSRGMGLDEDEGSLGM